MRWIILCIQMEFSNKTHPTHVPEWRYGDEPPSQDVTHPPPRLTVMIFLLPQGTPCHHQTPPPPHSWWDPSLLPTPGGHLSMTHTTLFAVRGCVFPHDTSPENTPLAGGATLHCHPWLSFSVTVAMVTIRMVVGGGGGYPRREGEMSTA